MSRVKKLGFLQRAIVAHMKKQGGVEVYIGPGKTPGPLQGYQLSEIRRSAGLLVQRQLIKEVKPDFYSFP